MLQEETGPGGKKLGVSGEQIFQVAVEEDGLWRLHGANLKFTAGFLDAVQIDGAPLDCPHGMFGASVTLLFLANRTEDAAGVRADLVASVWHDGLLMKMEKRHTGVMIVP